MAERRKYYFLHQLGPIACPGDTLIPRFVIVHFQGHTFGRSAEAFAFAQTSR
eukprot:COSAG06_NODE_1053_length_10949_cov_15.790968_12_plen_52_part_00